MHLYKCAKVVKESIHIIFVKYDDNCISSSMKLRHSRDDKNKEVEPKTNNENTQSNPEHN